MAVFGDRGAGSTSAVSMMWDRNSQFDGLGTVKVPKSGSGMQARIRDAMINGTSSYANIYNAFSAGGHDGNGSLQSGTLSNAKSSLLSYSNAGSGSLGSGSSGSLGSGSSGSFGSSGGSRNKFDYYEAPISEKYGFGKQTAYQEALANTAYRREMADMKKAGLNPSVIFGSHSSSGASSNIYPYESSSGGSAGYGVGSARGNSGKYLFSGGAYYGIMAVVGTVTSLVTGNVGAGMAAAGLTGTALKSFNGFFGK